MDKTTIRISSKTHKQLIKVRGKLEAKDGKKRTLEDAIIELINYFNKEASS